MNKVDIVRMLMDQGLTPQDLEEEYTAEAAARLRRDRIAQAKKIAREKVIDALSDWAITVDDRFFMDEELKSLLNGTLVEAEDWIEESYKPHPKSKEESEARDAEDAVLKAFVKSLGF